MLILQPLLSDKEVRILNDTPWVHYTQFGMNHIQTHSSHFICPVGTREEAVEILAHHDMDILINMPIGKRKYYVTNGEE